VPDKKQLSVPVKIALFIPMAFTEQDDDEQLTAFLEIALKKSRYSFLSKYASINRKVFKCVYNSRKSRK